ncbi:MAG: hypothetical protein PWP23_752 [Candidatus Sumerlaeota bacterium]|nr:hypothetical protein [Candidatus Sumerlaeota bacterium]
MIMPPSLVEALDAEAAIAPASQLSAASAEISALYRREKKSSKGRFVSERVQRAAYAVTRMPATFAAMRAVLAEVHARAPEFEPASLLDLGAGPGTVVWAATEVFPEIESALLLEEDAGFIELGERLIAAAGAGLSCVPQWRRAVLPGALPAGTHDLVTASYVLNEMLPTPGRTLALDAWNATAGVLVLVEPGTVEGYRLLLEVRELLVREGAHLIAPCPQTGACPLAATPEWCHFAQRLPRSKAHKQAKGASLGFEDEKYCYLAFSRLPASPAAARVIEEPRQLKHAANLRLCTADGTIERTEIPKRDKEAFRRAKKLSWGDAW